MHRANILDLLTQYLEAYPTEQDIVLRFRSFIDKTPACFDRNEYSGHITGSAFILSPDKTSVLLALHGKLHRWLQLGGHAEGETEIANVAFREAMEESGISQLSICDPVPIDLDIHEIPAKGNVPPHFHYDVRFLLISESADFICSHESLELKWVKLDTFSDILEDLSLKRAIDKICKKNHSKPGISFKLRMCYN